MSINKVFYFSVLLIFGTSIIASAQSVETVVLAGQPVMTLRYAGEYGTIMQRAIKVDQAIVQAISVENVGKPKLTTKKVGSNLHVYIGKTLLTKVYPQDAKLLCTTQAALAQQWIANFKRQFPLAEPSTHMGNPNLSDELSRAKAQAAKAANVKIASEDWAITQILIDEFTAYRQLTPDEANAQKQLITTQMYRNVQQHKVNCVEHSLPLAPHAPGKCPQTSVCPGCKAARLAAIAGVLPVVPVIEVKPVAPITPTTDLPVAVPGATPEPVICPVEVEPAIVTVSINIEPVTPEAAPVATGEVLVAPTVEAPAPATPALDIPVDTVPADAPVIELEPVKTEQEYIAEAFKAVPLLAQRRITNALKLSRLCDEARWKRDQQMIVLTLVKALRNCN